MAERLIVRVKRANIKPAARALEISEGKKTCPRCGVQKPLAEFNRNKHTTDGYQSSCRPCHRVRERHWRYGLTDESFQRMIAEQHGLCGMCRQPCDSWHVDHDHRCCPPLRGCVGCIRGLLCATCNRGLGQYEKYRQSAESYLGSAA